MRISATAAFSLLCCTALPASANLVFTGDPVVPKPVIAVGRATLTSTEPTGKKLDAGYEVTDLMYSATANAPLSQKIEIPWMTERPFKTDAVADIRVRIHGDVLVSLTGGVMVFAVAGFVDSNTDATIAFEKMIVSPAQNLMVMWDETGAKAGVKADNHTLAMLTTIVWVPDNVGDKVTFASRYAVAAAAIPEPSSALLALLSVAAFVFRRR